MNRKGIGGAMVGLGAIIMLITGIVAEQNERQAILDGISGAGSMSAERRDTLNDILSGRNDSSSARREAETPAVSPEGFGYGLGGLLVASGAVLLLAPSPLKCAACGGSLQKGYSVCKHCGRDQQVQGDPSVE